MREGSAASAEYGIIDYIVVRNVFGTTSRLGFKSCEAARDKFQGTSLDFVWFDEEPPQDIFDECRMRLIDKQGILFGTMTPLHGLNWLYENIYQNRQSDPEVWCEFMEWADNPFLPQKETEHLCAVMSEDELSSRRYGRFASSHGLVYPEFDPSVHVIPPFSVPREWHDMLSIDPGLNNPLSCHWYAVDYDGNVYVVAEHYEAKRDITYHAEAIKRICADLGWQNDSRGKVRALIDSAANQRTLAYSKSVAELFCEQGITVNTQVNKDVFSGINRVKGYLKNAEGKTRLYIFENCINLIREFKGYRWSAGDTPKKTDDHAMDELRYYISSRPEPPRTPTTQPERDRQLIQKKSRNGYGHVY